MCCALFVQHIRFDDFNVWEGGCSPAAEPLPTSDAIVLPTWSGQLSDFNKPTHLTASINYANTSLGSACGAMYVRNWASAACSSYTLEVNVRPGWGAVAAVTAQVNATARAPADVSAGEWLLAADPASLSPDCSRTGRQRVQLTCRTGQSALMGLGRLCCASFVVILHQTGACVTCRVLELHVQADRRSPDSKCRSICGQFLHQQRPQEQVPTSPDEWPRCCGCILHGRPCACANSSSAQPDRGTASHHSAAAAAAATATANPTNT